MRTLQLLTLALLATAAKADYYMYLCQFTACNVSTDAGTPDGDLLAALNTFFAPELAEAGYGAIAVQVYAESDAGWIGNYSTPWCCSDTNLFFFPAVTNINTWTGPQYMGNPDYYMIFAMNNQGEAVGAYTGTEPWGPSVWYGSSGGYFGGSVIPDPRLAQLGIDPSTFNVYDASYFTAVDSNGDLLAQGPGFSYELLTTPLPEPSTLPLFGAALAMLAVVLHCRSRKKA